MASFVLRKSRGLGAVPGCFFDRLMGKGAIEMLAGLCFGRILLMRILQSNVYERLI